MTVSSTFVSTSADGYERVMGRWSRRLAEPFLDFADWRDGESILDAGCGTGSLASLLVARIKTARIEAVDLSPIYIDYAARQFVDERLRFSVADICALPFADGSFDRVQSLLVLHFVPRYQDAIAEMLRVTRPGGTVAAAVWDVRGGFVANRMFFDTAAMLDPAADVRRARNYTRPLTGPGQLGDAWRAAGFKDVRETMLPIRMEFASFHDYWQPYLGKDGPAAEYVSTLSPAEVDRLTAAVHAAYLGGGDDGPRSYAAIAWAVAGTAP